MLKAFSGKELQAVSTILAMFVKKGEYCLPEVKEEVDKYVSELLPVSSVMVRSTVVKEPRIVCPKCGSKHWSTDVKREGITYDACRDCRYSRVVK
jgi:DNA-directed RNA polymerase subunit RPC12/RpoP